LRNRVRERGEDVQFALQRYAAERFLYRLGLSQYRKRFVLKGAKLFEQWGSSMYRPTRDLDFTGYGSSEHEALLACFRDICKVSDVDDALVFDPQTMTAEQIKEEAEYGGVRLRFVAWLGESKIEMQIDVGFGNAVHPGALDIEYPTLLEDPAPSVLAYPKEAVIAEKFQAMVQLGGANSRLKDFYDVYVLGTRFPFDGVQLSNSIAVTFERRHTAIAEDHPLALTPRFYADEPRAKMWQKYLTRNRLPGAPADFPAVGELLQAFLGTIWKALAAKVRFGLTWRPGGPWEEPS
jgi:hypothetical protein